MKRRSAEGIARHRAHVRHHRWRLSHRDGSVSLGPRFRKLWVGGVAANISDGVLTAALPLLAAGLTRNPLAVALTVAALNLPWIVFELFTGEIVDRVDRRLLMVWGNFARSMGLVAIAVLVATDVINLPLLYGLAFLIGVAETLVDTSMEALVPLLVPAEGLEVANGQAQAAEWTANELFGPPLGGFLFAVAAAAPFYFNAGAYLAAALLIALITGTYRSDREVAHGKGALRREIGEGIAWLWHHRVLRVLSLTAGASNLVGTAMLSVFVLYAQEILNLGDVGFGIILSAAGIGGIIGAALAHRVETRLGPGVTLLLSASIFGGTALVIAVTSSPWLVGLMLAIDGFSIAVWNVVVVTLRQELTPNELRGRVSSDARAIAFGAIPLGALLGGALANTFGLRAPFYVAAVVYGLAMFWMSRVVSNRTIAQLRADAAGE